MMEGKKVIIVYHANIFSFCVPKTSCSRIGEQCWVFNNKATCIEMKLWTDHLVCGELGVLKNLPKIQFRDRSWRENILAGREMIRKTRGK